MLKYITLILFTLSVLSSTAQDIKSMSIEELNKAKAEAINSENFELAHQIKDEISSRKSLEEIKAELIRQKKEALENENYQKASEIKSKLDKIEQVFSINNEIEIAVQNENFSKAIELKNKKQVLLNEVNGVTNNEILNVNSANSNDINNSSIGNVTLIFKKLENVKKTVLVDVKMDDVYLGTVNSLEDLIIFNVPSGKHNLELFLGVSPNNSAKSFVSSETFIAGETYEFSSIDKNLVDPTILIKIKENKKSYKKTGTKKTVKIYTVKTTQDIPTIKEDGISFEILSTNGSPYVKPITEASSHYTMINTNMNSWFMKFPEDARKKGKFNLGTEFTYAALEKTGLIAGFGSHVTIYDYNLPLSYVSSIDYWFFGANIFGSIGYQLEPTKRISVQGLIKAGPSWSSSYSTGYAIGSTYVESTTLNNLGFGGWMSFNGLFFLNDQQSAGLKAGVDIGFTGGASFSLGFVGGFMNRHQYRHVLYE